MRMSRSQYDRPWMEEIEDDELQPLMDLFTATDKANIKEPGEFGGSYFVKELSIYWSIEWVETACVFIEFTLENMFECFYLPDAESEGISYETKNMGEAIEFLLPHLKKHFSAPEVFDYSI
jgi:hypothetical protein